MEYTNKKLGYLSFISALDIGKYRIHESNRSRGEGGGASGLFSSEKPSRSSVLPFTAPLRKCLEWDEEEEGEEEGLECCEKFTQTEGEREGVRAEYQEMREELCGLRGKVSWMNGIVEKVRKELEADRYLKLKERV